MILLVAEQTRFRQKASYTGLECVLMKTVDNLIIKIKKVLQDLAKEQEILEIKTSLMTHELRLEELEESITKLGKDLQTYIEKQANLEIKASWLLAREEVSIQFESFIKLYLYFIIYCHLFMSLFC